MLLLYSLCITQKVEGVYKHSAHQTITLLPEMFRAACELQLVSCSSRHASQVSSSMHFLCTHISWKLHVQVAYGCLHVEQPLYCQIRWFCGLELHERFDWRATVREMDWTHSLIHFVHSASISRKIEHLQLYYTPVNSTATQDYSTCVKSSKAVTVSKLWPCTYITIWCATMYDNKTHWACEYTTCTH